MNFKTLSYFICFVLLTKSYLLSCSLIRGPRTLILLEDEGQKYSFSYLFDELIKSNYILTFHFSDDSYLTLEKYGEYIYENILILAPSTEEFGGQINLQSIIDFIDSGRSVFIAIDSRVTNLMRDIAIKCGMDIDEPDTNVQDYFHQNNNILQLKDPEIQNSKFFISKSDVIDPNDSFLYKGVGFRMNNSNPLVFSILEGYTTSYSSHPYETLNYFPHSIGTETILIGGLQTRNNGRVILSGSMDIFSNKYFGLSAINKLIALDLIRWCFKNHGIIRITSVEHFRIRDRETPNTYTIRDEVSYSIHIEELFNDSWKDFHNNDVQFEFRRIDPFIRLTLNISSGKTHNARFMLPDVYGVFQFIVQHGRIGYNFINSVTQVSVRPYEHVEYERYISCAFPYYFSSFSMLFGFILFVFIFLNHLSSHKAKFE